MYRTPVRTLRTVHPCADSRVKSEPLATEIHVKEKLELGDRGHAARWCPSGTVTSLAVISTRTRCRPATHRHGPLG